MDITWMAIPPARWLQMENEAFEFDPTLPGNNREQALAQVGHKAYWNGEMTWEELEPESKATWIRVIRAIDKAGEPNGPA
jgi:hypothetical protein